MAKRKKRWTQRKRELARQKARVTLKKRRQFIYQAKQKAETQFVGIIPLIEYQEKMLQLREKMSQRLQETKGKNAIFKTPDVAVGMVTLLQMGFQYLEHIPHFLEEVKVAERFGLRHFFSENVVRDWIERKPQEQTEGLKRLAQDYVLSQGLSEAGKTYVDVDQTSIRSYATKREGAVAGYGSHSGFASAQRLKQAQELVHRFPNLHFIMAASASPKESALLNLIEEAKQMSKKRWRKVSPTT